VSNKVFVVLMAKERIPEKGTRSFPLAGGMQDDVPEFVQDFPTLAYIENGRFNKINEVEKTLPEIGFSPSSPPSGVAVALEAAGDTLLAIGVGGAQRYTSQEGWKDLSGRVPTLTSKSDVCSSSQAGGGVHFDWAKSTYSTQFYVIAYETRSAVSKDGGVAPLGAYQEPNDFILGIETFTPSGELISKKLIRNALAPRVSTTDDGRVIVHYVSISKLGLLTTLAVYDTSTEVETPLSDGSPIGVAFRTPAVDAVMSPSSTVTAPTEFGGKTIPNWARYNAVRMGLQNAGKNPWYQVSYPGAGGGNGYLLYADKSDDTIYLTAVDETGQIVSGFTKIVVASTEVSTSPLQRFPLGLFAETAPGKVWALYGLRDATANTSGLYLRRYLDNGTGFTFENGTEIANGAFTIINASVAASSPVSAEVAYTRIEGDEGNIRDSVEGRVSLRYGRVLGFSYAEFGNIPHHALTSTNRFIGVTSQYFVCEQFNIQEPFQLPSIGANFDVVNPPLAAQKPTTAILLKANDDGTIEPLSTFDATTSKHSNLVMQEQNPFLGTLDVIDDDFFFCNRQFLQNEDYSKRVYNTNDTPVAGMTGPLSQCLYMGEWRGNLYKVDLTPEKIFTEKFGESVILNTGIPLWYSGGEITEMSVLEQPEIRYIDTESDECYASGYLEPLSDQATRWSQYQIIVGYVDSKGQAHRSAPSFPFWAAGITYVDSNDKMKILGFTRPITMFEDDAAYFIEVYMAEDGEAPSLAFRSQLPQGNSVSFIGSQSINVTGFPATRFSETVYTLGGEELGADPWPTFDQTVVTSRRMFAIEGSTLYFSKLLEENLAPEFSTGALTIPFGRGRDLLAIGKIDDKVLVFEKDTIHAIYGTGLDNTGEGNPFIVDHLQTTVGCSDPESVVEIPEGLLFYSSGSREFHLIDRDLNIQDIGTAVQDLTENINILAAVVFPKESEVRWYTGAPAGQKEFGPDPDEPPQRPPRPRFGNILPSNPVLVFNYHYKKWTVLSGQPAVSVALWKNEVVRLQSDWGVFATSEQWANAKLLKYRLPWARVEALQNFGRIREIVLLGKYLSAWKDNGTGLEAGDIKLTCRYDYEANGLSHEYLWRANVDMDSLDGDRLQFGLKPGKPKCQAIQITVEEVPTTQIDDNEPVYTNGRGFVLSGLDLLYSLKQGFGLKSLGQRRRK